jgi:hypothetical protein
VGDSGKSFKSKKKRKRVQGDEKIKLQKKLKSTLIRAEKRQTKTVNLGWDRDRKDKPISTPSIHVGPLVGAGSLWPQLSPSSKHQKSPFQSKQSKHFTQRNWSTHVKPDLIM